MVYFYSVFVEVCTGLYRIVVYVVRVLMSLSKFVYGARRPIRGVVFRVVNFSDRVYLCFYGVSTSIVRVVVRSLFYKHANAIVVTRLSAVRAIVLMTSVVSVTMGDFYGVSIFLFVFVSSGFVEVFYVHFFFVGEDSRRVSGYVVNGSMNGSVVTSKHGSIVFMNVHVNRYFLYVSGYCFLTCYARALYNVMSMKGLVSSSVYG